MTRRNMRLISIATAIVTVITLNAVLGRSQWAYGRGYGNWRSHCWGDDRRNSDFDRIPPNQNR